MSTLLGTITSCYKEERTIYVRKRPVHLKPGGSHDVTQLTEAELAMVIDDPDLDLQGTVEVIRYKNFRDFDVLGRFSTEDPTEVKVEDVVVTASTEETVEGVAEETSEETTEETVEETTEEVAEETVEEETVEETTEEAVEEEAAEEELTLEITDPKSGNKLLAAAQNGFDLDTLCDGFHVPAFVDALEIIGVVAEGNKRELADTLLKAVHGG